MCQAVNEGGLRCSTDAYKAYEQALEVLKSKFGNGALKLLDPLTSHASLNVPLPPSNSMDRDRKRSSRLLGRVITAQYKVFSEYIQACEDRAASGETLSSAELTLLASLRGRIALAKERDTKSFYDPQRFSDLRREFDIGEANMSEIARLTGRYGPPDPIREVPLPGNEHGQHLEEASLENHDARMRRALTERFGRVFRKDRDHVIPLKDAPQLTPHQAAVELGNLPVDQLSKAANDGHFARRLLRNVRGLNLSAEDYKTARVFLRTQNQLTIHKVTLANAEHAYNNAPHHVQMEFQRKASTSGIVESYDYLTQATSMQVIDSASTRESLHAIDTQVLKKKESTRQMFHELQGRKAERAKFEKVYTHARNKAHRKGTTISIERVIRHYNRRNRNNPLSEAVSNYYTGHAASRLNHNRMIQDGPSPMFHTSARGITTQVFLGAIAYTQAHESAVMEFRRGRPNHDSAYTGGRL